MKYVGIVLVSHSEKIVYGLKDLIREVTEDVPIEVAGGTDEGTVGTSIEKITTAIKRADRHKGVLLFYDLGSAKINAELAIELSNQKNIVVLDVPLLEGAYVAAVESSIGKDIAEIMTTMERDFPIIK